MARRRSCESDRRHGDGSRTDSPERGAVWSRSRGRRGDGHGRGRLLVRLLALRGLAGTRRLRNRRPENEARMRALTDAELVAEIASCRERCRASRPRGKEAKAQIDDFQRSQAEAAHKAGKNLDSIVATPHILECRAVVTQAKSEEREFRDLLDEMRRRHVQAEASAVLSAVAGAGARESAEGALRAASGEQSAGDGSDARVAQVVAERLEKEAAPRLEGGVSPGRRLRRGVVAARAQPEALKQGDATVLSDGAGGSTGLCTALQCAPLADTYSSS